MAGNAEAENTPAIPGASLLNDWKVRNNSRPFDEAAAERYLDRTHDAFASRITGIIDTLLTDKASHKAE